MRHPNDLSLPEEILLLALHDEKGTIGMDSHYSYAVGGAVLAELLMAGRIELYGTGKKRQVMLADPEPTGRRFLDDCLGRISESGKSRSAQDWVSRFAHTKQLKHRLAQPLCDRGILREGDGSFLLLFTRRIYPEVDSGPESELIERLRRAIFSDDEVDPRTAVLVSLAHHATLLPNLFDKRELKTRKARIEEIGRGDACSQATREAIEAMRAAVFVAVIVPSIVATTSS
jgi:hypothetical protein